MPDQASHQCARALPAVRRLPVPQCEPPYDDELPGGATRTMATTEAPSRDAPVQGTLALAFVLPNGLPAAPSAGPELRLVPELPDPATAVDADFGPQPTPRGELPDPRAWAPRLVQAVVEVLAGVRPAGQLIRWTNLEVYDDLRARQSRPPIGAAPPVRASVRSVHVSEPADGIAEVAATVRRGARYTAVALRLEGLDGRWQCTAVDMS